MKSVEYGTIIFVFMERVRSGIGSDAKAGMSPVAR